MLFSFLYLENENSSFGVLTRIGGLLSVCRQRRLSFSLDWVKANLFIMRSKPFESLLIGRHLVMLVSALLKVSYYDILLICCCCDVILFQYCHAFTVKVA